MNEGEVHELLEEHDAIKHGHFKLSSGKHSDVFVQTALVLIHPGIAERFGHELGRRFAKSRPEIVLSPALAGLIIGHEVARQLNVPHIFCERVEGKMTLRRGFVLRPDQKVLIADNAITDGKSKFEVMDVVKEARAEVVGLGVIADRSNGVSFGVPFERLMHLATVEWEPDACPLCAEGKPIDAPGSRHLR